VQQSGRRGREDEGQEEKPPQAAEIRVVAGSQSRKGAANSLQGLAVTGWFKWAAILLAVYLGYQLALIVGGWARTLMPIIVLVAFGAILAFLLAPLPRALERMGLPRTLAIVAVYVVIFLAIGGAAYGVATGIAPQVRGLSESLPAYERQAETALVQIDSWAQQHGLPLNLSQGGRGISAFISSSTGSVAGLVKGAFGVFAGVVDALVGVLVVFVLGFFFLHDGDRIIGGGRRLLPEAARPKYDFVWEALATVVGGYIRAQLLMALIIGCLAALGSWLVGIHAWLVIGLAALVLELVPLIGALVAALIAVIIALFQGGLLLGLATVVVFIVIHVIEGYILGPRIQGTRVHMHPLGSFLAMLVGIKVAGILGALFAVPLAGLLNVMMQAVYYYIRAQQPEMFGLSPAERRLGWMKARYDLRRAEKAMLFTRLRERMRELIPRQQNEP
jgi:predicted PurR-regulated permease PerM